MSKDRLYDQGILLMQRKKELVDSIQEQRVREELEEVFDYPEINYKSRAIIGERDPMQFHEYSTKWLEDRNKKLDESRRHEIEKERSFSPIKRSGTPKGYQSLITDWENRVSSYYEKKNKNGDIYSHTPEINSNSRAMLPVYTEPVEERLGKYQREKDEKMKELKKKLETENVPSFRPLVNASSKARPEDVTDYLYMEGISMMEKKKRAAELCNDSNFPFKPVINENSKVMAGNRKQKVVLEPVVEVVATRVLKPEEFESFLERNYIKRPKKELKIDESPEIPLKKKTVKTPTSTSLYEKEMKRIMEKEQKRSEILKAREVTELNGCTFKPKLSYRIKTPPPATKSETQKIEEKNKTKGKYLKGSKSTLEHFRYEDKNNKIFQLKANYCIDKTLLHLIESLERKVDLNLE